MTTQDRPTLRERQYARTREEIEDAAWALFAGRGYEATTVEQIAAAAGVSTRTFFRYFPSKEDAVFGDHAEVVARFRAALGATRGEATSPLDRVRRAVLATQQPGRRPDHQIARARLVAAVPALRARLELLVEELEDAAAVALAAELGPDPEPEAALRARILAGAAFAALRAARRAAATLPNPDPQHLVEAAFALLEPVFAPDRRDATTTGRGDCPDVGADHGSPAR